VGPRGPAPAENPRRSTDLQADPEETGWELLALAWLEFETAEPAPAPAPARYSAQ